MDLGGFAIKTALLNANIDPEEINYVLMGHVLGAGQGQITARQASVKGGISMQVPATTVNKVCLSGLNSVYLADLMIRCGDAEIVVAGGMESMSQAPYLLPGARNGLVFGDKTLVDSLSFDGLFCPFDHFAMGESTDFYLKERPEISRQRQDEFALLSHERAFRAKNKGRFNLEITPVPVQLNPGELKEVTDDEGIRPSTSLTTLSRLIPAFSKVGTITAGNASQISDGATALVLMSEREVLRRGIKPLARIISYAQVAGPDTCLLNQPSNAILMATKAAGISISDLSLIEINEAFSAVALASIDSLGVSQDIVNVNGGAISLGHPIGASGARLALTLAIEMNQRGSQFGTAALCGGGGQGDAIVLEGIV